MTANLPGRHRIPAFLAGVVAVLIVITAVAAYRYLALEKRLTLPIDESAVWATAQMEVEAARFLASLEQFARDPEGEARAAMEQRFEVLLSRVGLFDSGVNARWLSTKPKYGAVLERFRADLAEIDAILPQIGPAGIAPVQTLVLNNLSEIKSLTSVSLREEVDERDTLIQVQSSLRRELTGFALAALGSVALLLVWLARAEARARHSFDELLQARTETEAARRRLFEAISAINEGFVLFDADDRMVMCNARFREYFALSGASVKPGASFEEILRFGVAQGQFPDALGREQDWIRERVARRALVSDHYEIQLGDGRWLMVSDRRTHDGGRVGVRTDITELKTREAELEDARARVQRQAEEMRQLAEEAQRANAAKSEFMATLSHEIRTPMNAVVGLSELLAAEEMNAEAGRYVQAINEGANQLLHLINTILDISRLEAGGSHLEEQPFSLDDLLTRLVAVAGGLAATKPVAVRHDVDPALPGTLTGDGARLYQVLLNLLANAVKFTQEGEVCVRALVAGHEGERLRVRFEVRDTGAGLPDNVRERLFEPFVRGAHSSSVLPGTGLGLSISHRFVQLMGGSIGVAETSRQGTVFYVEVSMRPGGALAAPALAPSAGAARSLRVLVAEDTPGSEMVVRAMLQKLGHSVISVPDGQAAVEAVMAQSFDVVLMDMQMPRLDGLGATRAIRALPRPACDVPVVFLTAQALPEARRDAISAGAPLFLTKPVRLGDLRTALGGIVSGQEVTMTATVDGPQGSPDDSLDRDIAEGLAELREAVPADAFRAIAKQFAHDSEEWSRALAIAVSHDDAKEAGRSAHKLAGIFGQVGLTRLAALARDASREEGAEATCAARELLGHCDAAVAAIQRIAD